MFLDADAAAARHADILDRIAQTQDAITTSQELDLLLEDLRKQLDASETRLVHLEMRRAAELRDVEKYRDSSTRRLLHRALGRSAAYDERAAKEEREYHDVLSEEHAEHRLSESLRQRITDALRAKDTIAPQVSLHRSAQRDLDDLYAQVFSDQAPGQFPAVDAASRDSDAALQRYHDVRDETDALREVASLLTDAVARAPLAHKQIELTLAHESARCLHEANRLMGEIEALVQEAQALSPVVGRVPRIRTADVAAFGDPHYNVLVDGALFRERVRVARDGLRSLVAAVEGYDGDVKARIESLGPELKSKEDDLERTRLELQRERGKVFEEVLRARKK